MCNCNQKRAALHTTSVDRNAVHGMRQVRLVQQEPLTLTGDVTGRVYEFREKNDINWVDKKDLVLMEKLQGVQVI
jgi:DNA/RNA endonuclease YhcR with UshA esterase domain